MKMGENNNFDFWKLNLESKGVVIQPSPVVVKNMILCSLWKWKQQRRPQTAMLWKRCIFVHRKGKQHQSAQWPISWSVVSSAVQNNQNKWQPRTKIAAMMTVIKNTVTMKTATTNTTTMKTQEREASSWMVNSWFTLDISCLNDFNWSLNNHHNIA